MVRVGVLALVASSTKRSQAQKPACKEFGRNDQKTVITAKFTDTPVSNRGGSRSFINALAGTETST
ncbi:alpha-galactosidase [Lacticaseibacillus paracasei]|nr:alpha-galactosidase [Lacticaseibacillus paracasei]MCT3316807.1 alpha-galactosidase [Lacticaseibacillus paracasei]GAN43347.1 pyrophosphatase [Lacticaseibacillus paracasei NRIC 1981]